MSWKLQMSLTLINLHVSNHLVPFGWALRVVCPLAWHDITMFVIEVGEYLVFCLPSFPLSKPSTFLMRSSSLISAILTGRLSQTQDIKFGKLIF